MTLKEKAIIRKMLIDDNLSFDENKYNVFKFRGFDPDANFTKLDEIARENGLLAIDNSGNMPHRFGVWDTEMDLLSISTEEELLRLFDKDMVFKQGVGQQDADKLNHGWQWFIGEDSPVDEYKALKAEMLDPFIARLIRAFIKIGLYTDFSCDGWHKSECKRNILYSFSEHYSVAWHDAIFKVAYEEGKLGKCSMKCNSKNSFEYTAKSSFVAYEWLNLAAQYLENNERRLIEAKERLINDVYNGLRIDSLEHVDLVNKMREYL